MRDARGDIMPEAQVELRETASDLTLSTMTDAQGAFSFPELPAGEYAVQVLWHNETGTSHESLKIQPGDQLNSSFVEVEAGNGELVLRTVAAAEQTKASGGEKLSSREVSDLPLNKRDFSQLLLLAAGTMTDTNGSANFTQQFAVNGQRGIDRGLRHGRRGHHRPGDGRRHFLQLQRGCRSGDRVDSGVMPAEIGHGAAGFTNIITKSGTNLLHGSVFEFVRNSAFDARNFFDQRPWPTRAAFRLSGATNSASRSADP